jgi:hypothetical protein
MSYRALSPTADRDLALMGLLVAALASLMALGSALVLGAAITTILVGGPWQLPDISAWIPALVTVVGNPAHPGAALGEPWSTALPGHTGLYWMVTVLITALGGGRSPRWGCQPGADSGRPRPGTPPGPRSAGSCP